MMEAKIEIWEANELPLLSEFLEKLAAYRDTAREIRYHDQKNLVAAYRAELEQTAEEVPAQPINEVLEDIHATPPAAVTEADAVAAFRAAAAKGAMPKIVAALEAAGVKRVTELQAEQRAAFVGAIS